MNGFFLTENSEIVKKEKLHFDSFRKKNNNTDKAQKKEKRKEKKRKRPKMTTVSKRKAEWENVDDIEEDTGNDDILGEDNGESQEFEPIDDGTKTTTKKRSRSGKKASNLSKRESKKPRKEDDKDTDKKDQEDAEGNKKKKATVPVKKRKQVRMTQAEQRSALEKMIKNLLGEDVRFQKREVLTQLNDMTDQVIKELVELANKSKIWSGKTTLQVDHAEFAIRNSKLPISMRAVMLEKAGKAVAKFNSSRADDKTGKAQFSFSNSVENRAGLTLKVMRVKNLLKALVQPGKSKDKATESSKRKTVGKPNNGSRISVNAVIAIVAAVELVMTRVIALANNHVVSRGGNKLTKKDVYNGVALDKYASDRQDIPDQAREGLANYFSHTVFTYCGTTELIPERLAKAKEIHPEPKKPRAPRRSKVQKQVE